MCMETQEEIMSIIPLATLSVFVIIYHRNQRLYKSLFNKIKSARKELSNNNFDAYLSLNLYDQHMLCVRLGQAL